MSGDILTVKTVKRVRSVRGSALVHINLLSEHARESKPLTGQQIAECEPFLEFLKTVKIPNYNYIRNQAIIKNILREV